MGESKRERLLLQMILNVGSAATDLQQIILTLADSPAFTDDQKRHVLASNATLSEALREMRQRAQEYQRL